MSLVNDSLGIGNVMNSRHAGMFDTKIFMHHLDHGRQTVGGTGCSRDNIMPGRIITLVIHSVDNVDRRLWHRRRYQYLFNILIKIGRQLFYCFEFTGAVDHKVNTHLPPVHILRIDLAGITDLLAFNDKLA